MSQQKPQPDFVISLAGPNIDTTIVTIEEMQLYCQMRKRLAIVGTEKKSYSQLDKMVYHLVGNYEKPKACQVVSKNKPYLEVYNFLIDKFKNGLLIVEGDTISNVISDNICNSPKIQEHDVDVMICRDGIEHVTEAEMKRANLFRIHANPEVNMMAFQDKKIAEFYNEKVLGLFICQLFANAQHQEVNNFMTGENKRLAAQGMTDFINYYEYNKQLSFFLYFDVVHGKILNLSKDRLMEFLKVCAKNGIPIPENQHEAIAESLTILQK